MIKYIYKINRGKKMTDRHIEIERRFIIKIPPLEIMRQSDGYTESEIAQIYLDSGSNLTHRIRSRKSAGNTAYTETKKIRIDRMSAIEDEREISEGEFYELIKKQKVGTVPVRKTRHTFHFEGQLFEVDIYPNWKKTCILETELKNKDERVLFPYFIEIIEEVTGDKTYSNVQMSRRFPQERDE